jgi:excisionase family DNA binding protein
MEEITLTTYSKKELKDLIKECIKEALFENKTTQPIAFNDKPMSIKEVSEFLNVSVQTIYGYTHSSLIPHFKKGKKLYFLRSELNDWIKEGRRKTYWEIEKEANDYIYRKKRL